MQPQPLQAIAKQLRPWPEPLDLDEQIEVAGETYYVKDIKKLFRARDAIITDRGATLERVMTVLIATPWNEHDPNAVAVLCEGYQVGHVPADMARNYHGPIASMAHRGFTPICWSRIWAKSDGGVVRARATVLAPEADVLAEIATSGTTAAIEQTSTLVIEAPAAPVVSLPVAGWYSDPSGMAPLRWWDGQQWTSSIRMR